MMKQVNLTMTDEEYSNLIKETGRRQAETGIVYKPTTVAMNIIREVLANDPIRVSPPDVETNSQDDSQNVTEDAELSKQPGPIILNKDKSNLFNFNEVVF